MTKKRIFTLVLAAVLAFTLVFSFTACGDKTEPEKKPGGDEGNPSVDDPYVVELRIVTPPTKTEYMPGEEFDSKGMKLAAEWSHGVTEDLDPSECTMSPSGALAADTEEITFTYEGKSCVQKIVVNSAELVSIELDRSALAEQQLVGTVDLYSVKVYAVYDNDSKIQVSDFTFAENGTTIANPAAYEVTAGEHTIKVTYKTLSAEFKITAFSGYTVDATNIVYSEVLEKNRDEYIGTNFVENPAAAVYDADGNPIISGTNIKGFLEDGTEADFPGNRYRAGSEQGTPCLADVKKGQIMRFHIWSDFTATVELVITASSGYLLEDNPAGSWIPTKMGDMQFNKLFDVNVVSVNSETGLPETDEEGNEVKTPLTIGDEVILPGGESENGDMALWAHWQDVSFGEIELQEGDNIIELIVTSEYENKYKASCAANIVGFEVRFK